MNAVLTVSVFGGLRIQYEGAVWERFRTDKTCVLLLYLVLNQPQAQRRDHLATLLWPESNARAARTNLRVALHDLRSGWTALTGLSADTLLQTSREFVHLQPGVVSCDVLQFNQLLADSNQHAHQDQVLCPSCATLLAEAADLGIGTVLSGFLLDDAEQFNRWVAALQQRVEDQTHRVLKTLIDYHRDQGQQYVAIGYMRRLLDIEPWNEANWQQLFSVLGSVQDLDGVEKAFAACSAYLLDELQVAPSQATVDAYETARAKRRSAPLHGSNVKPDLLPFFGREAEVARLTTLLSDETHRLITLTGIGGIGKTRLARHIARRLTPSFADGVWLLERSNELLQNETAKAQLLSQLATTFRIPSDGDLFDQLTQHLKPLHCLIVLDDMESQHDISAMLLELLRAAPGIRLLITSREPLNAYGETVMSLQGLDMPADRSWHSQWQRYPAIQLFVDSARRVRPAFQANADNWPAIVALCQQLGGMPLAIKLAAALLRTHMPAEILSASTESLQILVSDSLDLPVRQQRLINVLAATWQHLSAADRQILSALSVFRDGFSLSAAVDVARCSQHDLSRLIARSLLQNDDLRRMSLHPLLRKFAKEQGNDSDMQVAAARHAAYFLERLNSIQPQLFGEAPLDAATQLSDELANCAAAAIWSSQQRPKLLGQRTFAGLVRLHDVLGQPHTLATLLERLDALASVTLRPHVQLARARLLLERGNLRSAQRLIVSTTANDQEPSPTIAAYAQLLRGDLLQQDGYPTQALAAFEDALSTARRYEDTPNEVAALSRLTYFMTGTTRHNLRAVALAEQSGDVWLQRHTLNMLGISQANAGAYEEALHSFLKLRYIDALHDEAHYNLVALSGNIGRTYLLLGEFDNALRHFEHSLAVARLYRSKTGEANAELGISAAALARNSAERALESAEIGANILLRQRPLADRIFAHVALGRALLATNQPELAHAECLKGLDIASVLQLPMFTNLVHAALIEVLLVVGEHGEAAEHGQQIWLALRSAPINRTVQPTFIYWQATQALQRGLDTRWEPLLREAAHFIEQRAGEIADPQLRHSYLTHIPANRQIDMLAKRRPDKNESVVTLI